EDERRDGRHDQQAQRQDAEYQRQERLAADFLPLDFRRGPALPLVGPVFVRLAVVARRRPGRGRLNGLGPRALQPGQRRGALLGGNGHDPAAGGALRLLADVLVAGLQLPSTLAREADHVVPPQNLNHERHRDTEKKYYLSSLCLCVWVVPAFFIRSRRT